MSDEYRNAIRIVEPQPVLEGAGVRLRRSIGGHALGDVDPFLLLDHFASDNPADYLAGFPMHPHRGIETVTYMLAGEVRHRDSLGNTGTIGAGDAQWMTSGRGILHEEMPHPVGGRMAGFQLWVNLPARLKMTAPRYQDVRAGRIPVIRRPDGTAIRVIAGAVDGVPGPVTDIAADPAYLDVTAPPGAVFEHPIPRGHAAFAYVFEGAGVIGGARAAQPRLVVLDDGDRVAIEAGDGGIRFLLVSGRPLDEPIARYGPFVMNTHQEIRQALEDLRNGTFAKQ